MNPPVSSGFGHYYLLLSFSITPSRITSQLCGENKTKNLNSKPTKTMRTIVITNVFGGVVPLRIYSCPVCITVN